MGQIVISSGTYKIDLTDATGGIWSSAVDLSGYVSATIDVADTSGNHAISLGKQGDDAEAFGIELAPVFALAANWQKQNALWVEYSGYAGCAGAEGNGNIFQTGISLAESQGMSIKYGFELYDRVSGVVGVIVINGATIPSYDYKSSAATYAFNYTLRDISDTIDIYIRGNTTPTLKIRNITCKRRTSLGTDALQVKDSGGDRGWDSIDVGFDPNDIATVTVTPASRSRAMGMKLKGENYYG